MLMRRISACIYWIWVIQFRILVINLRKCLVAFKNIRKMNVRTKLIVGFSIIVVLLWLLALFTSIGYRNLNQQFLNVEEEVISEILTISNIESLASETYRGTLDYMFRGSEEARLNTLSLLDLLVRIGKTSLSPGEEIDQELVSAIGQYNHAINNLIAAKDRGADFDDLLVMDQVVVLPALVSLQEAATAQNMLNNKHLAIAKADFNNTYTTGLRSIITSVAVITFVALLAAILTTRSIIRPLNKLRKGTEMVAQGNLSYKVGTKASDEIGQLSRDFDRMTEELKKTMTSVDNLNTEISERKKVETALQKSEEKFRVLFENARDAILLADAETGMLIDVNQAGCELLGLPKEKIIGMHQSEIHPEGTADKYKELFREHIEKGNTISEDMLVQRADGTQVPVDISASLVELDGKPTMQGIFRDITLRKQAEAAIRESEEKFSVAFRSSPHPMSISSVETSKFIDVNDSFTRITGYTRDEVIGRTAKDLNLWVNHNDRKRILQILKKEGRVDSLEYLQRVKSGEIRILLYSAEPISIFGEECIISVTTDITKRREAEEDLRASQEFNSSLLEKAPHQVLVINPDTSIRYVNPKFEEVNGWTLDEIAGVKAPYPWWPEEARTEEALEQFKEAINMDIGQVETTVRKKNGELYWLDLNWVGVKHDDELQYCLISSTDITERKKRENLQQDENSVLTLMGQGAELGELLDAIIHLGENHDPSIKGSILIYDPVKQWLNQASGPSLPEDYLELMKGGMPIGPTMGSCGTAAYRKEQVIIPDIANSPLFESAEEVINVTAKNNMLACWSQPILSSNGGLLGTIANYSSKVGEPDADNINILEWSARIAAIAIERKQAEEALQESEEKFSKAFRSSPNAIVITTIAEGRFIDVNDSFLKLTGYTREEVIGNTAENLNMWADIKDRAKMLRVLKKDGSVRNHEYNFRIKSGEIRTWLFSAELIDIGNELCNISINLDITDQKRAEEALKESEEFSSSLMRNSAIPILVINEDTSLRYVNPSFEKLTGFSSEEILGKKAPMPWWIDEGELADNGKYQKAILKGVRGKERLFQKKNGDQFWVEVTSAPVKHNGQFIYSLSNWLDITERKQMENELRVHRDNLEELVRERTMELTELNKRLQHELKERQKAEVALLAAKDEAETANKAKSEFLARTSHEIRTPIHGVMGTINLVLDSKLEHDQRQYLKMAISSAEALLNIINDILDLSKIEAGQLEPEQEGFNLRTTLEDTLDSMAVTAHNKGLELTCHLLGGVATNLIGDPRHLRQVLVNLIGNSIKFTEKGEVALYVEPIAENKKETELRFTVRDTGIGIPGNKSDMIFEPFQQADGSINRKYGGTGLGLTISRHLIKQMGGRIWVEKGPGKGSVFHFTGKFAKQTNGKHSGNGSKNIFNVRNMPLLLVDDNTTNRLMIKDMLIKWGFDVTDVDSGATALKVITDAQAKSARYRIVMLDKTMDGMDGFAVAEQMLNDSTMPSDIIMMLPPHSVSDDFSRCQKLGISNYVIKPIKESELKKALLIAMGEIPDSKQKTEKTITTHTSVPGLRILVAEDNSTSQLIARKTLEKMGHHVEVAQNGSEAVKMAETGNFDLILMDAEMPVLNGLEATRLIRKSERAFGRHVPIVAMTAYAMKEDKKKCLEAGMDAYLSKPAKPEDINAIVAELFAGKEKPVKEKSVGASASFSESEVKEISTVDMQAAMKVFGDDDDLLKEAVDLFLEEDYPQQIKLLKEGIERLDTAAVRAAAHSIKGAARTLGGMVLGDVALRLEKLGSQGKLEGAEKLASKLEDELKHFADYYSHSMSN